jgi:hypothetical protein
MQVHVEVDVVAGTVIDDRLDLVVVGGLVGRALGVGAAKPKILVHGKTDTVGVPNAYRLGDDGHIVRHDDAVDRGRGAPRSAVARGAVFHSGEIHPFKPDGAAAAGVDDLVTGYFQLGGGGVGFGRNGGKKEKKGQKNSKSKMGKKAF